MERPSTNKGCVGVLCGPARNTAGELDAGALIKRRIGVFICNLGKLDLTLPAGKLMLTMLTAMAEMERTQSVLHRVKAEGKTLGRPVKTTKEQPTYIVEQQQAWESISALSRLYGISRASVMRVPKPVATIP